MATYTDRLKSRLIAWNQHGDQEYPLFFETGLSPRSTDTAFCRIYFTSPVRDSLVGDMEQVTIFEEFTTVSSPALQDSESYRYMMVRALNSVDNNEEIRNAIKFQLDLDEDEEEVPDTVVGPSKSRYVGALDFTILRDTAGRVYGVMDNFPNIEEFDAEDGTRILDSLREQLETNDFSGMPDTRFRPRHEEGTEVFFIRVADEYVRIRVGVIIGTKIVVCQARRTDTSWIPSENSISYYVRSFPPKDASSPKVASDAICYRIAQEKVFLTEEEARASITLDSKV